MDPKYEALFTPWKIGNVEIKNRIVMCSMGGTSLFGWMEPSHFDKEAAYFLLEKARNGVGLVLPGMQWVRDVMGNRWLYNNKSLYKPLKEYMKEFHKTGSKLFIQLAAGCGRSMAVTDMIGMCLDHPIIGKLASPIMDAEYLCASASDTPNRWKEDYKSKPLTVAQIQESVAAFGKTAKLLREAGVDGVEIHAVHEGYTLDQFAIANFNYRTDQYGGSLENRLRFATDIVKEIKKEAGADFPVSLRYSVVSKTKDFFKGAVPGEEFKEFGRDMAESEKVVKLLEEAAPVVTAEVSAVSASAAQSESTYVKVTADALNVRTGPGTDYAVADELAQGKVVKVLGAQDGWYQIGSGYIDAAYTEAATYEEALEQLYIRVVQGPLNIRSGPGTGYSKVGSLAKGRCVKVVSVQSGWYQIEQGYVSAAYVEETDYTPAAASSKGQELANIALQYVGYSYVYGGASPRVGFDCSGLVQYACAQLGYSINRTASAKLQNGVTVSWDELAPGDLVFFKKPGSTTSKPVTHVGMYIGSGQFVHASDYGVGVIVSNLSDAYYTTGYVSARRIAV